MNFFQTPLGINTIPDFVSARSPKALRIAMFQNSKKHKGFIVYQDIQWVDKEQKWYAWFYVTEEDMRSIEKLITGGSEDGVE